MSFTGHLEFELLKLVSIDNGSFFVGSYGITVDDLTTLLIETLADLYEQ